MTKQLPVSKPAFLEKIRSAKPKTAIAGQTSSALVEAALAPKRPRLVFAMDATASREQTWEAAKATTDTLFTALPGSIDIALAVHGGGQVHTFTPFSEQVNQFRDQAAGVRCSPGETALVPLMERTLDHSGVKVMLYIGDAFEENTQQAYELADSFRTRGIRAVMLYEDTGAGEETRQVFAEISRRTNGACVDFRNGATQQEMREVFEAVAVLASGGTKLLRQKAGALPAAAKLLTQITND